MLTTAEFEQIIAAERLAADAFNRDVLNCTRSLMRQLILNIRTILPDTRPDYQSYIDTDEPTDNVCSTPVIHRTLDGNDVKLIVKRDLFPKLKLSSTKPVERNRMTRNAHTLIGGV